MAGEVHNSYFCEASSDSGGDEDREDFLGRKIRPEKAFKLLNSVNERKTMKLPCLRSRRHRKRPRPLAPVDFAKDSSSSSSRTRMEDDCDQSDTFSEVKSSSSFGTSNFLGNARCEVFSFLSYLQAVYFLHVGGPRWVCISVHVKCFHSSLIFVTSFKLVKL